MTSTNVTTTPRVSTTPKKRRAWVSPLIGLIVGLALLSIPTLNDMVGIGGYYLVFGYTVFFWVTQATSWNIFSGYAGYLSFGHAAFYGAGVYVTANLTQGDEVSIFVVMALGAVAAALLGAGLGFIIFRRGLAHEVFALFTFALAIALGILVRNIESISGGGLLMVGKVDYPEWLGSFNDMMYYCGLGLAAIAVITAILVQRSRFGKGLFAIRDDEHVAETIGVPTFRYKLIALTISAGISGASGALNAVTVAFIEPEATFGIEVSVFVVLMALVGGRRHWIGPIIGAVLIYSLQDRLTGVGVGEVSQLVTGALLVFVVVRFKGGIYEQWRKIPIIGTTTFLVALVLFSVSGVFGGFIEALLAALVLTLILLLIPDKVWARVRTTRREKSLDA